MNNSKISIRHAKPEDLPEIQTLFVNTIEAVCCKDYTQEQRKAWISSVENTSRWAKKLDSHYFILAQIESKIVGYASLENNNYLDFLYVHKDYQKQGIANRLYAEIEAEAIEKDAENITSDVSITAKPFFEKKGFKTMRTQKNNIRDIEIINYKMMKIL